MKKLAMLIASVMMLSGFIFSEYDPAEEPEKFEAKYYDNARVVRVKYTQGETYIKRSYEEGAEEATVNLPVFENDTAGTTDGRLELYLGKLNYIRLDYDSEVSFETVPELRKTNAVFRVVQGGIYLEVNQLDGERDIEVQTPDCGVFILEPGRYRINVNDGVSEVIVQSGTAEVAGQEYERVVRENQKIVMKDGDVRERPFYVSSNLWDDFDSWNDRRAKDAGYSGYSSARYLNEGYEDYESELSRNGRWRYNSSFSSYIWIPYNIGSTWRPYYNGRWVWNPHYGNVWSSYDSWGWYTHHYGRWHWEVGMGWYWIPGYRWSPAWVSWFGDDNYYGWSPLSWWNRPIVIYNNRWYRDYSYRHGVPYRSWSTIIIKKNHLHAGNLNRYAINESTRTKLAKNRLSFRGDSPMSRPTIQKVNVTNARGKRLVFKENGIVNASKYKVVKNGETSFKYSGQPLSKLNAAKYKRPATTTERKTISRYSIKKTTRTDSNYSSGSTRTPYTFKPKSKSDSQSSSTSQKTYKGTTSKSTGESKTTSSSKTIKAKKRKDTPSYSFNYSPQSAVDSSYSSESSATSRRYDSSSRDRTYSYKPKSELRYTPRSTYRSNSSSSYNSSYNSSSGSDSTPSTPRRYSTPYRSSGDFSYKKYGSDSSTSTNTKSYTPSSSSSSRSTYSSSSSSRSYSKPSSSSSSHSSSSSTRSISARSSSSSSSGHTFKRK